ncbi:MAG: hypothetical protein Q9209_005506 [Squamulea sp. 1 TL-2023]
MAKQCPEGATSDTEGDSMATADSPFHRVLVEQQAAWDGTPFEHVLQDEQSNGEASLEYQAEESVALNDYSAFMPPCWNQSAGSDGLDDQASEHTYSDEQVYEGDDSRRLHLHKLTEATKSRLRRQITRLRRVPAYEDFGEPWNHQPVEQASCDTENYVAKPTIASRLTKLRSNVGDFVKRRVPMLKLSKTHGDNHESTTSINHWPEDSWSVIEAKLALEQKVRDGAVSEVSKFVDPLPESSLVESNDFLSRFLFKRRNVDIHLERKHKLSRFLLKMCEEASFAHVSLHAPSVLSLLRISTPDEIELRHWIEIIDSLRSNKKIPAGIKLDNEMPGKIYGVLMVRHTATHRMDYDSKLIESAVWFLEKLNDDDRRRQVQEALEEMYQNECATVLRAEAETAAINLQDRRVDILGDVSAYVDLLAANESPRSRNDSADSNNALVGSGTYNSSPTTTNDHPAATYTQARPSYISAIEVPTFLTTYHRLFQSYQDTLETSLFHVLRQKNPSFLTSESYITPSQIELNEYDRLYSIGTLDTIFEGLPSKRVKSLLTGARWIRNAAAHRKTYGPQYLKDQSVLEGLQYDTIRTYSAEWAKFKQVPEPRDYDGVKLYAGFWACHIMGERTGDTPKEWSAPGDEQSTLRFYSDAQDLMALVGDEDAERKIRLATWVADRNLSVSAGNKRDVEAARSLREREEMLIEVKKWQRSLGEEWKGQDDTMSWLYERLDDSINYYRDQVVEAKRGCWGKDWYGIEEIFNRWVEWHPPGLGCRR